MNVGDKQELIMRWKRTTRAELQKPAATKPCSNGSEVKLPAAVPDRYEEKLPTAVPEKQNRQRPEESSRRGGSRLRDELHQQQRMMEQS